jgi:hypothetical protein
MKLMTESEKRSSSGSLYTYTYFKDEDGNHIKISIRLESEHTHSNAITYYKVFVYYKGYGCRNWSKPTEIKGHERYHNCMIKGLSEAESKQAIYTAMNNHWERLNPLLGYVDGTLNGVPQSFNVVPLNTIGVFNK